MSTCGKCASPITDKKDALVCGKCRKVFHVACTRFETAENLKVLTSQQRSSWICEMCEVKSSRGIQDFDSLISSIRSLEKNLSCQIGQVNANLEDVKGQLAGVNSTISSMQTTLSTLVSENESLKTSLRNVEEEYATLKNEVNFIKSSLHNLEQYSRRDNIEIVGVPYSREENVYSIIAKIASLIQIKYNAWDVSIAHRLPKTDKYPNPAIIVKFVTRECKAAWMNGAFIHRQRLTGAALSDSWPSYSFYINDHLTIYNKKILGSARAALRDRKLASVWTRDCKVWARKSANPECKPICLRSMEDLSELLK